MKFARAEMFVIKVTVTLIAMIAGLVWAKGIKFDVTHFDLPFYFCLALILIGQFYRNVRLHEPIAASLTVVGLSFFLGKISVTLSYMYLPYSFFGFDQDLAVVDGMFGFVWRDFALGFADMPSIVDLLRVVYSSSYYQILIMIFVLGITSRVRDLHDYMAALAIGVLICISVWAVFPSSSPVGFQPLPLDIAAKLRLGIPAATGAELIRLGQEGISAFPPTRFEGMVGFPSFHTVMLIATVYAARNLRRIFYPALAWNLAMFPAILLHGAHNLVDVFGGIIVAVFSIYCARKMTAPENAIVFTKKLKTIRLQAPANNEA